jgi:hypothetical protein
VWQPIQTAVPGFLCNVLQQIFLWWCRSTGIINCTWHIRQWTNCSAAITECEKLLCRWLLFRLDNIQDMLKATGVWGNRSWHYFLQNNDIWHISTYSLQPPHFSHNGTDGKDQNHTRQTADSMIYVGHDEQFHIFHSMQYNSITMQTTVLEVQQYFKNHNLPGLGAYWSIISQYNKQYKTVTRYTRSVRKESSHI